MKMFQKKAKRTAGVSEEKVTATEVTDRGSDEVARSTESAESVKTNWGYGDTMTVTHHTATMAATYCTASSMCIWKMFHAAIGRNTVYAAAALLALGVVCFGWTFCWFFRLKPFLVARKRLTGAKLWRGLFFLLVIVLAYPLCYYSAPIFEMISGACLVLFILIAYALQPFLINYVGYRSRPHGTLSFIEWCNAPKS